MKIFISWSGDRSRQVAAALRDRIPFILPYAEPWMSDYDIDGGSQWDAELYRTISECQFAIACVTPENLRSPWLHFEAGEISRSIHPLLTDAALTHSHVPLCPYLFDITRAQLPVGPLDRFQAYEADPIGTKNLLTSIGLRLDRRAHFAIRPHIKSHFDKWWYEFSAQLERIPTQSTTFTGNFEACSDDEFFECIAELGFHRFSLIEIMAHTGKRIVASLLDKLKRESAIDLKIRILLRNPFQETGSRGRDILNTARSIAEFAKRFEQPNITLHYYDSLPVFRSIIAYPINRDKPDAEGTPTERRVPTNEKETRIHALLAYYYYKQAGMPSKSYDTKVLRFETHASNDGRLQNSGGVSEPTETHLLRIREGWFDAYWGRSKADYRRTHSIILDFDDTIVDSNVQQINRDYSPPTCAKRAHRVTFCGDNEPQGHAEGVTRWVKLTDGNLNRHLTARSRCRSGMIA